MLPWTFKLALDRPLAFQVKIKRQAATEPEESVAREATANETDEYAVNETDEENCLGWWKTS